MYSKGKNVPVLFRLNYTFACSGLLSKVCVKCCIKHEFLWVIIIWNFIIFEIGGSHNSVAEDWGNLGCYAVLLHAWIFMFQRIVVPPSSSIKQSKKNALPYNLRHYDPSELSESLTQQQNTASQKTWIYC
jgi:hypothetical protein